MNILKSYAISIAIPGIGGLSLEISAHTTATKSFMMNNSDQQIS